MLIESRKDLVYRQILRDDVLLAGESNLRDVIASFEKRLIESTLEAAGGVQKRAAELLHIKPTTLNEMIKRHDIRPRRKRVSIGRAGDVSELDDVADDDQPLITNH